MFVFRLALGCVGSLALPYVSVLARTETLALLTENLVPFNMAVDGGNYARNGGVSGVSTDTMRAACEYAQVEYQLILRFPWDRVCQQALSEPGYGVFSTARTSEREDKFEWVGPLAVNDWVLMTRGDNSIHLNNLEDAARYYIGGYRNNAISQHLVSRGLQVQLALRGNKNIDELASEQIDLWITADPSGRYVTQYEGLREVEVVRRLRTVELFLVLNKDAPNELVQKS